MFDQKIIISNKKRSVGNIKNSDFFQFIYSDLIDRLLPLDNIYYRALIIGEDIDFISSLLKDNFAINEINIINPYQLDALDKKGFDLICFPYGMHWINDVQKFLLNIKSILNNNGIFICNFPGAGSLNFLRTILFRAEESVKRAHFPHISPFIRFEDVTPLLQQSGFNENIIDCEILKLEHDSPIKLMKALKKMGESNAIQNRVSYSITKSMYQILKNQDNNNFYDQINLVTLVASPIKSSIKLKSKYFD